MNTLLQDLRYAIRTLAKSPTFTAIAVLTLALGIGANTAIFSVVNTSLLRPLPFPNSAQLVDLWAHSTLFDFPNLGMSWPDIADVRAQNTVFSAVAPYNYSSMTLTGSGAPQALDGAEASVDFFPLLGMKPLYGRIFNPAEMQPGEDREVILSFALWQKQFGSDPRAVGKTVTLDGKPYTVIAVMPPQQHLDYATDVQFWTPLAPTKDQLAARGSHGIPAVARLKPGRTVKQAQAELDAIAARLAKAYPDADKTWSFRAVALQSDLVGDARAPLLVLLGAVGFVLLIACANVGSLFLARGWARRREMAIRSTLGATRGRIVRQLLIESVSLALIGGACGLLIATWGVPLLRALLPADTPRVKDLGIDQTVLWFTLGASVLAGILFGLAPAILASRQALNAVIKEGAGAQSSTGGSRHGFLRRVLVTGEVALALMLVVGATLALRSFGRLRAVNLGFRSARLLTMNVAFAPGRFPNSAQAIAYVRQIVALTRAIPGVQSASASLYAPLSGTKGESVFHTETTPQNAAQAPTAEANRSMPGYFQTLGIPLLRGRDFTNADAVGAPDVYIVNQAFAEKFFGNASPIGKRLWIQEDAKHKPKWGEIVGEIGNTRDQSPKESPEPEFFAPYEQPVRSSDAGNAVSLVVRAAGNPFALVSAIQNRIWSVDKDQPITNIESMDQLVAKSNASPRFQTFLLGIFGALGLLLAVVGIYGVISYSVAQRTHEISIRMALGAEPEQVMRLILAHGLKLAATGIAIGIGASLALTRLMSSLLFGISVTDPLTFAGVSMSLLAVALAASYIPARRAMRVDPMVALRHE